jgi:hypothetical protein
MVPSAENLVWTLAGLAAGLVLAMAGFALMAFIEHRALRRRLRAGRRAAAALAETAPAAKDGQTAPLFAAPAVTEPVAAAPGLPPAKDPIPQEAREPERKPAEAPGFVNPGPAGPEAVAASEAPKSLPPPMPEPDEPGAVPAGKPEQSLPKGIQAAVAEAAKRRRAQRAKERGEPLPPEPVALPKRGSAAASTARTAGGRVQPYSPAAPVDGPVRSDVNVEALFEKAFGEATDLSTIEKPGRDAGPI